MGVNRYLKSEANLSRENRTSLTATGPHGFDVTLLNRLEPATVIIASQIDSQNSANKI